MAGPTLQAGSLCAVEISLIFPYDGSDLSTRVDKKESKQASQRACGSPSSLFSPSISGADICIYLGGRDGGREGKKRYI